MTISFSGTTYTQSFDSLSGTGTANVWANDTTIDGWYLFRQPTPGTPISSYNAGTGSSNAGNFYSFGTSGSAERALGGLGSGGAYFGSPANGSAAGWIAFAATNSTDATISSVTVGFNGEQWRDGGLATGITTPSTQSMTFQYGFGTQFTAVSSWITPGGDFNWSAPVFVATTSSGAAVDGNVAGLVSGRGGTLNGIDWSPGTTLWFRWLENNDAGNDHGLAIDDFSLMLSGGQGGGTPSVSLEVSSNSSSETAPAAITVTAKATAPVVGNQTVVLTVSGTGITAGDYSLSNTTITIPDGESSGSVTVTVTDDTVAEGPETAVLSISSPSPGLVLGSTISQNIAISDNDTAQLRIRDIQGQGHLSPLRDQAVANVPGIVTAVASNGFFLQDPEPDNSVATSEGIFVFTNTAPTVAVGDSVLVTGTVFEFRPGGSINLTLTEITSPIVSKISSSNALPAPIVLGAGGRTIPTQVIDNDATNVETSGTFDPSEDGIDFWESLEGMLVQINNPVTTSPTALFQSGSVVSEEIWVLADGGADASGLTARGGSLITETDFNPERIQIDDLNSAAVALPVIDVGTRLSTVVGVVNYANSNYEVQVATAPTVVSASTLQREVTTLTPEDNVLRVATFNVENLDPRDGVGKFSAIAQAIVTNLKTPEIINLEEVQDNNGPINDAVVDASVTLQTLIEAIKAAGGPTYEFRQINPLDDTNGGEPGGNIRVAFLFDPARVDFVDRAGGSATTATTVHSNGSLSASPGLIDPLNAAFSGSRKPLIGEFSFNGQPVFVVGNHFNSKGGDQPLFGVNQPPALATEAQRLQQAAVVKSFVDDLNLKNPGAKIIVAGDLNDFEFSNPVSLLESGGLTSLIETLPASERYTYNFQGNAQALDHLLVSNSLLPMLTGYDVVHINAEFADQVSDHDPVIAGFLFGKTVNGTSGRDLLMGTAGNDVITGGAGRDAIVTGAGGDLIVYTSITDFFDVVVDFEPGKDKIDIRSLLSEVGYTGSNPIADGYVKLLAPSLPLPFSYGSLPFGTLVQFDADGNGDGEAARLMVQVVGQALTAEDFLFGST